MNKSKRGWIIGSVILLTLVVIGFANKNWLYTGYYYTFKYDHFNKDDNVYANPDYFKNNINNAISFYKLIRPLNTSEINELPLSASEKALIKVSLINAKTYLISPHIDILKTYLDEQHTNLIGTYIKQDVLNIPVVDKDGKPSITFTLFYAINPNKKVVHVDANPYLMDMPKYYKWASNTLYVFPSDVTNKAR